MNPPSGEQRAPVSPRAFWLLLMAMLLATAGFTGLGVWQVQRRAWKLDLITRIDTRIHAPPVDAPGPSDWSSIDAAHDAYRHVRVHGVFRNDREAEVQAVTRLGAGYWVITPLTTDRGFTILVNRGFVPQTQKDPATRPDSQIHGPAAVTGLLRITEPHGGFLQSNDPAGDRWHSRDVAAIAASRHLNDVAPYFIDAAARPGPPSFPMGGLTVVDLPNNHLVYALIWFTMAALSLAACAFVVLDARRGARQGMACSLKTGMPAPDPAEAGHQAS